MKKLGIFVLIVLFSCEKEFLPYDPTAKPKPVVHALIDTKDPIHYIRLTKTFTGSKSAYELAKDTSNVLYDSVRMIIECLDTKLGVVDSIIFHKTYFIPPSSGIFNTGKSWYYVSTDMFPPPDSCRSFRLKAWIYDTGDSISTEKWNLLPQRERSEIEKPDKRTKYISVYDESVNPIVFLGNGSCGIKLRFNYIDVCNDTQTEKNVEYFWSITNGTAAFHLTPARLFIFLRNSIPKDPDVDYRLFRSLDIFSYAGPKAFILYYQLFNTDRSFLSDVTFFETPSSNIINGYGLFCEYTKDSVTGLKFDQETLDSLADGLVTKGLNFVRY